MTRRKCEMKKQLFLKSKAFGNTLIVMVFLTSIALKVAHFSSKESMFVDEYLSVILTNYERNGWFDLVEDGLYDGKTLKDEFFADEHDFKAVLSDIVYLRKSTRDIDHANLYYSLLRVSFFGVDSGDVGALMTRGFLLNILLFGLSFFFFYKLLRLIISDWGLIICSLAIVCFSPFSIANTLFIREYQLQETLFVLFVYLFSYCVINIQKGEEILSPSNVLSLSLVIACVVLSGYFGVLYIVLFWIALSVIILYNRPVNKKSIVLGITVPLLAIIITTVVYPQFFSPLDSTKAAQVASNTGANALFENVKQTFYGVMAEIDITYYGVLCLGIIVLLIISRRWRSEDKIEHRGLILFIILSTTIYCCFILYVSPLKSIRYILSALPFVYLIIPFLFFLVKEEYRGVLIICFIAGSFISAVTTKNVYIQFHPIEESYKTNKDVPLVLVGITTPWMQAVLSPLYDDDRIVELVTNEDILDETIRKYDDVYLAISTDIKVAFITPLGYTISETVLTKGWYVQGYRLVKDKSE